MARSICDTTLVRRPSEKLGTHSTIEGKGMGEVTGAHSLGRQLQGG